jgi:glucose-6-phosphate 1-dehydrogenase
MNDVYTTAYLSGMKKQYNFRFDDEAVNDWQKVADLENRSLTNLIETVMKQYASSKLPPKAAKESMRKRHTK